MFEEWKKGRGSAIALSGLMLFTGCRNDTEMTNKTMLGDIYNKTEDIQNEVLKWNSHSDEEKYFLNAQVLHQVTQEICKNIKGDKFISAEVKVQNAGYIVDLKFFKKYCSFRLPLFTDMLTKERASELILSTIQSSRFSCSENISTQSP